MKKYHIGHCEIGGLFIGRQIQSQLHKSLSMAVIISTGSPFTITIDGITTPYYAAFVPQNIAYELKTNEKDTFIFAHIDPYSKNGLMIDHTINSIQPLNPSEYLADVQSLINEEYLTTNVTYQYIERFISKLMSYSTHTLDERILGCIDIIRCSEDTLTLDELSTKLHLSHSRLSHLFKSELGITIKQYTQHQKLTRSIKALNEDIPLTKAAFFGGFSSQSHFTNTFKKHFGIKPSDTKHSI